MLHAHWPGSTMRWLCTGHVGAFLFHRSDFLAAIRDAFARLKGKGDRSIFQRKIDLSPFSEENPCTK